jgi:hypothetical protein
LGGFNVLRGILITDSGETDRAGFDEIRVGRSYESVTSSDSTLVASPNEVRLLTGPTASGSFTLPFGAPIGGTYVLERQLLTCGGPEAPVEFSRQTTAGADLLTFVDTLQPCGAIYRVRRVP